jgi:hypothetical protein
MNDRDDWRARQDQLLANFVPRPEVPAPRATQEQFERGEISADDYAWLNGSVNDDGSKARKKRRRR